MPAYPVEKHIMRYDLKNNCPWVIVYYRKRGVLRSYEWYPNDQEIGYITHLLKSEDHLYYVESGNFHYLSTDDS